MVDRGRSNVLREVITSTLLEIFMLIDTWVHDTYMYVLFMVVWIVKLILLISHVIYRKWLIWGAHHHNLLKLIFLMSWILRLLCNHLNIILQDDILFLFVLSSLWSLVLIALSLLGSVRYLNVVPIRWIDSVSICNLLHPCWIGISVRSIIYLEMSLPWLNFNVTCFVIPSIRINRIVISLSSIIILMCRMSTLSPFLILSRLLWKFGFLLNLFGTKKIA